MSPPVRDAASIILVRRDGPAPTVLMGRRGRKAAFQPDRFVFPGGAVDEADAEMGEGPLDPDTARRLSSGTDAKVARALPMAAIRELWEETGLALGRPDPDASRRAAATPAAWRSFLGAGLAPRTEALRLVFRAVTPEGRPRRFDARFFLADAAGLANGPDDFAGACGELADLRWLAIADARALPLPFVTGILLGEIDAILADPAVPRRVPWFRHDAEGSHFHLL